MAEITAALVKELREKTGAGMMDCKKALGETGGDLEAARLGDYDRDTVVRLFRARPPRRQQLAWVVCAVMPLLAASLVAPVRFANVAGLRAGDPVQTSGVKVGRVANVVLQGVGNVMVYLEVNRAQRPHADAVALVASADFFGAKYVDYVPGSADQMLKSGEVINGTHEAAVTEQAATARVADLLSHVGLPADRGYDHDKYRRLVWERGIKPVIARRQTEHGSGLGRHRWVVERTFAWLHNRRRLLVRTDRRDDIHEAFLALTCCLICRRRLELSSS